MARTLAGAGPERTNRLILIGAIALAVVAAVLVFASLSSLGGGGGNGIAGGSKVVVVAAQDIKAGTKITSDMVTTAVLPDKTLVDGAVVDKQAVVGLTTLYPIYKNDQISSPKLGQTESSACGFRCTIPPGMVAVSVPISETTSVGGLIQPGDYIDITALYTKGNGDSASSLLQNVLVLAVGQNAAKPTARLDSSGQPLPAQDSAVVGPDNQDPNNKAKTLTVAVNPQDVATIALATDQGKVYLSLRPPGDTTIVPAAPADTAAQDAPAP
jgi:pilus assembly protein CpaB